MAIARIFLAAVTVAIASAGLVHKRETECRVEGLFVGGSVVGEGYIMDVASEQDCTERCKALDKCTAVNYFPEHRACLPQEEAFIGENKESLASDKVDNTVYVIVKGCEGGSRRKREANCRLQDVYVGGSWVDGYLDNVPSEEACVEKCQQIESCTAVNYWPEHGDCLPQVQSLADPEYKERLSSRVEPGTVYVAVKGCQGDLERPANILPEAELPEESAEKPEGTGEETQEEAPAQVRLRGKYRPRPRRQAECRKEKLLVGGSLVGEPINDVETEEACVEACKQREGCKAVNYFFEHKVCWPQQESLLTDADYLETREDELTNYVIVHDC